MWWSSYVLDLIIGIHGPSLDGATLQYLMEDLVNHSFNVSRAGDTFNDQPGRKTIAASRKCIKLCQMADVHSPRVRSYNMSRIRGKDTGPEVVVREFLRVNGYRMRLNDKKLPGRPDIVIPKYKTIIFVNGCFWHGHPGCKYFVTPKTRTEWWLQKISITKKNDAIIRRKLRQAGWHVFVVWECNLKPAKRSRTLKRLIMRIGN